MGISAFISFSKERRNRGKTQGRAIRPGLSVPNIGGRIGFAQRRLARGQPYVAHLLASSGLTALSRPCDAVGATSSRICRIEHAGVHRYLWSSLLGASLVAGDAIPLSGLAGSDPRCLSALWIGSVGSTVMERKNLALLCAGAVTGAKADRKAGRHPSIGRQFYHR